MMSESPSVAQGARPVTNRRPDASGASFLFKFSGSRPASINRVWLEALTYTANFPAGLHIVPEPPRRGCQRKRTDRLAGAPSPYVRVTVPSGC